MKLTLRDLFWCILLVASLTIWRIEYRRGAQQIVAYSNQIEMLARNSATGKRRENGPVHISGPHQATETMASHLSDDELEDLLTSLIENRGNVPYADAFDVCLTQMEQRGLADRLARIYRRLMARDGQSENLQLLIALRRARGQRDPLRIDLALVPRRSPFPPGPETIVEATVTNIDVGNENLRFRIGGDYRGGRHEHWSFILTDGRGREVAASNYCPVLTGGLVGQEFLPPGASGKTVTAVDLRKYIAPPQSGNYHLQAIFHCCGHIAPMLGEPRNLTGLIVTRSKAIPVVVVNPNDRPLRPPLTVQPIFSIVAGCAVFVTVIWFFGRHKVPRSVRNDSPAAAKAPTVTRLVPRDAIWCASVLVVALLVWSSQRIHEATMIQQEATIDTFPDSTTADWSIALSHK